MSISLHKEKIADDVAMIDEEKLSRNRRDYIDFLQDSINWHKKQIASSNAEIEETLEELYNGVEYYERFEDE